MTKIKFAATSSKNNKMNGAIQSASDDLPRMAKELEICSDESCETFTVDKDAERVLGNTISEWVPVSIYLEILDFMRGLEPKLAMKVAQYIGDFCWGMGRTVTGIEYLDDYLMSFYKRIYDYAKTNDHKLEMPIPF